MRPSEGAAGGGAAVTQTVNAANLTRAEREKIERDVMRGAKYRFG
jgi:hypothetical protein